jgi:hypothetical protein
MQSNKFPKLAPAPPKRDDTPPPVPVPARVVEVRPRASRASASRASASRTSASRASTSRRTAANHACVQCRKTKTKCDGKQPCARCQSSSNVCTFDAKMLSGERLNTLTHAFNEQKGRLNHLETILAAMRTGTDAEAAELMAWIRIGESVQSIVSYLESKSRAVVVSQRSVHSFASSVGYLFVHVFLDTVHMGIFK